MWPAAGGPGTGRVWGGGPPALGGAAVLAGGGAAGSGLLWVVLPASRGGIVAQALVVRLPLAPGRALASLLRERLPRPVSLAIWLASEIAIVATELAELLGGAIAF